MNISAITVVQSRNGADTVVLHVDKPDAAYPYKENTLTPSFKAAKGNGVRYCAQHFPNIPIEVVGD